MKINGPSQQQTQQLVETHEVIHMGVADKDVAGFEQVAGGKVAYIPQIEEQGPFLKRQGNEQSGVVEWSVNQTG